jgi:hypothetical protein
MVVDTTGARLMTRYFSIIGTIVLGCLLQTNAAATNYLQRQTLAEPASGEGAPARGFGTQVAVDGDLAVVADLASTLNIRPAIVGTYVRTAGVWTRQAQELNFNTGSPSNKIKLALGDDTLALMYPGATPGSTQARIYRWVSGQWQLEQSFGAGGTVYESIAAEGNIVVLGHPGPEKRDTHSFDSSACPGIPNDHPRWSKTLTPSALGNFATVDVQ